MVRERLTAASVLSGIGALLVCCEAIGYEGEILIRGGA